MPISTSHEVASRCEGDKDHFRHVLDHLFIPAIKKIGHDPVIPSAAGADVIHAEIIRKLETEDLVLCDMSALNPNVFFELGIRTALDKPICLVRDSATAVPFDAGVLNYHTYDSLLAPWTLDNEVESLALHLSKSANGSKGRNTLWKYFGLTKRAEMNPAESPVEQKIDLILMQLGSISGGSNTERVVNRTAASDRPKSAKWVVAQANVIAGEVNAKFTGSTVGDDVITLDIGSYLIGLDHVERIRQLAAEHGFSVKIMQRGKPFAGIPSPE